MSNIANFFKNTRKSTLNFSHSHPHWVGLAISLLVSGLILTFLFQDGIPRGMTFSEFAFVLGALFALISIAFVIPVTNLVKALAGNYFYEHNLA